MLRSLWPLSALRPASRLHTARLDLSRNQIHGLLEGSFAALQQAPHLYILYLSLSGNDFAGNKVVREVLCFKDWVGLCTLGVDLLQTNISDEGCHALAQLRHAPQLEALSLDLGGAAA